mmetsp:Transcript_43398/g.141339  ORF Transcript_43398/g.141339 Transcript_43398/m.141339 type:complete len:451 (+) Transcript_43398:42-1394(+)
MWLMPIGITRSGAPGLAPLNCRLTCHLCEPPLHPQLALLHRSRLAVMQVELEDPPAPDAEAGVVCARGVCVLADEAAAPETCVVGDDGTLSCEPNTGAPAPGLSLPYLWPRGLLLFSSVLYGTNFPLGRIMNEALPPSAATSARLLLAAAALSPFLPRLAPELRLQAMRCGCFTALGYVTQSAALVDTPAATVAFLGALTVVVCPALAAAVDGRRLGLREAPQVWLSAGLALAGVGVLELADGLGAAGWGDLWSVLQAVGFGTSFFLTERLMAREPGMALPITAAQCAVSAAFAGLWAVADGSGLIGGGGLGFGGGEGAWLFDETKRASYALPGLLASEQFRPVALAVAWTGLVTTAGNRIGETVALGRVASAEASVLLATEPLWAALFASLLLGESVSGWDAAGGALLVSACLANAASPEALRAFLPGGGGGAAAAPGKGEIGAGGERN